MMCSKALLFFAFISCALIVVSNAEEEKIQSETITAAPSDCKRKVKKDDFVHVYYIGTFVNGTQFDNHTKDEPFAFRQGGGEVIKGWEQAVEGMCVGEKKKITVPPTLGYGVEGYPNVIPANSTLLFEITLVNITDDDGSHDHDFATHEEHDHFNVPEFEHMDTDKDNHITKEEIVKFFENEKKLVGEANFTIKDIAKTADELMKEHDVDKDGKISFEENQNFGHEEDEHGHNGPHNPHDLDAAFKDIDTDGDNQISVSEMKVYLLHVRDGASKEDIDAELEAIFGGHDTDQNEIITHEEIQHAKEVHDSHPEHHEGEHHDEHGEHHEGEHHEEEEEGHGGEL